MVRKIDFTIHTNPLGTPDFIKTIIDDAIARNDISTDNDEFYNLRTMIARRHGAGVQQVAIAQSAKELIFHLADSSTAKRVLLARPCPNTYAAALKHVNITVKELSLHKKNGYRIQLDELQDALREVDMLIMGNPAYPSGALIPPASLIDCLSDWIIGGGWLILDESAIDFTYGSTTNSIWSAVRHEERVAIIRSFTDFLAMPLFPLNYVVGGKNWISESRSRQFSPYVAPLAGCITPALDHITPFRTATVDCVTRLMPRFLGRLRRISGIHPFPTDANWVLCHIESPIADAVTLTQRLAMHGITIATCADKEHFTLALKVPIETDKFIKTTRKILMPK